MTTASETLKMGGKDSGDVRVMIGWKGLDWRLNTRDRYKGRLPAIAGGKMPKWQSGRWKNFKPAGEISCVSNIFIQHFHTWRQENVFLLLLIPKDFTFILFTRR